MQYADDTVVPIHSVDGLQRNLHTIATAYERAGLIVNTKKTEIQAQEANSHGATSPSFSIAGDTINRVSQFTYLSSILTKECDASIGRLSQRVFLNRNLTSTIKVAVYSVICEAWFLYRRHVKALEVFHICCLQGILGLR